MDNTGKLKIWQTITKGQKCPIFNFAGFLVFICQYIATSSFTITLNVELPSFKIRNIFENTIEFKLCTGWVITFKDYDKLLEFTSHLSRPPSIFPLERFTSGFFLFKINFTKESFTTYKYQLALMALFHCRRLFSCSVHTEYLSVNL